jgi:ABC-type sugar transport system substrate-binding protein
MEAALIAHPQSTGFRALVNGVSDADSVDQLLAKGIDGILTDPVDALGR